MKYLILALLALSAAPLPAARVFQIKMDTPTLVGVSGFLDFQFNPGGADADPGSATISSYSGGTLGSATTIGDVSGSLPGPVVIANTTGFNDLFQAITFGSQILFRVTIDGPVVDTFDPLATAGSSFAFSLYADDGLTPLLTADPLGFAATIDVGPQGAVSLNNLAERGLLDLTEVPEPSSIALILAGAALLAVRRLRA